MKKTLTGNSLLKLNSDAVEAIIREFHDKEFTKYEAHRYIVSTLKDYSERRMIAFEPIINSMFRSGILIKITEKGKTNKYRPTNWAIVLATR